MSAAGTREPAVYLVDASIYIFRAWFSLPEDITDSSGNPCNAFYGFARFLCELLEQTAATHISVSFDTSLHSSFRNELYPEYKANRDKAPPELSVQFEAAREFTAALGLHVLASERYEADDLIASAAELTRSDGWRNCFVSADKDLTQLLRDDDTLWDFARGRVHTRDTVLANLGIHCEQVPDYLALMGDAVDNIPGVKGVGAKTASALLGEYASLEALYENLEHIESLPIRGARRVRQSLEDGRDQAFTFRELTRLVRDAPVTDPAGIARREPDWIHLSQLIDQYRLGSGFADRLRQAAFLG